MKLLKFIEQLKDAYKNALAKIKAELERNMKAEKEYRSNAPKYNAKTNKEECNRIKQEHKENMNAIVNEVNVTVERVRAEYEKEATAEYQPKGAALNAEDVALLNSGILLSADEVARMVQKHADNITMLRVIENYVKNNKIRVDLEVTKAFKNAGRMIEVSMRAFDNFTAKAKNAVWLMPHNDPKNDTIFTKCNERIAQYVEEYKNEMQTGIAESEV